MSTIMNIRAYIQSKQGAWAETTLRSESARLHANHSVLSLNPSEAHTELAHRLSAYALKTTMIRCADFRAFLGDYTWKAWIKQNANLYKQAYTRSVDGNISYEEAKRRATLLPDLQARNIIDELLDSGVRSQELRNRTDDRVLGKGSKSRKVFSRTSISVEQRAALTYRQIYNACKAIGTTPHACRKAYANKIARSGAITEVDMLKIMGWESLETAKSYLTPMRDEELASTLGGFLEHYNFLELFCYVFTGVAIGRLIAEVLIAGLKRYVK